MRNTLIGLVALVVLGGAAALWFVFGAGTSETSVDVEDVVAVPADEDGDSSQADDDGEVAVADAGDGTTYSVDQSASTVAYELDEVLRGEDVRVVGTTSEVATNVVLDPADPSTLAFGDVAVNARTLATDSGSRDNAVRGRILQTDDPANELIVFSPQSTSDLPGDVSSEFTIDVTGDLTISGITEETTFQLTVTPEGDGFRIAGDTTVLRSVYGLEIPSVPSVADVGDEVLLRVDLLVTPA